MAGAACAGSRQQAAGSEDEDENLDSEAGAAARDRRDAFADGWDEQQAWKVELGDAGRGYVNRVLAGRHVEQERGDFHVPRCLNALVSGGVPRGPWWRRLEKKIRKRKAVTKCCWELEIPGVINWPEVGNCS
jgi:hypothetical protein